MAQGNATYATNRRLALIINNSSNNKNFQKITQTMDSLNFRCVVHENLSNQDLRDILISDFTSDRLKSVDLFQFILLIEGIKLYGPYILLYFYFYFQHFLKRPLG